VLARRHGECGAVTRAVRIALRSPVRRARHTRRPRRTSARHWSSSSARKTLTAARTPARCLQRRLPQRPRRRADRRDRRRVRASPTRDVDAARCRPPNPHQRWVSHRRKRTRLWKARLAFGMRRNVDAAHPLRRCGSRRSVAPGFKCPRLWVLRAVGQGLAGRDPAPCRLCCALGVDDLVDRELFDVRRPLHLHP
jgi:hypothetical protein